ncbi:MAG: dTMP kinase [Mycobacterium sp.]|nr:dTMP kinase [Mycobacterium sp.]
MAWLIFIAPVGMVVVANLCLALAIFLDARTEPIFPRWVAYFNTATAAAMTPAACAVIFRTGPLAWDGAVSFWLSIGAFGLNVAVMFVVLRSAINRQASDEAPEDELPQDTGVTCSSDITPHPRADLCSRRRHRCSAPRRGGNSRGPVTLRRRAGAERPGRSQRVLIAIEGVDGAGKQTLTQGLRSAFETAGKSVATLAFPRYGTSVHADLAAEALHGGHGDLSSSVYAMAVLFALDRAGAHAEIAALSADHDVVILDRYVASNAAYSAARLHQGVDGEVVAWLRELEFGRLGNPAPDWQVLLAVPTELAAQRAQRRADADAARARDAYERDDGLQRRTNEAYAALAAAQWGGRWVVAGPDVDAADLAPTLAP